MIQTTILKDDQWYETYEPEERMYETYGEDMNYINSMPAQFVWTLLDGDEGDEVIVNGKGLVNRIGYYISKKPHNTKELIVVEFTK